MREDGTRDGGVHTVRAPGWWNVMNGKTLSRHVDKQDAVDAGRAMAQKLEVEHTIHDAGGESADKGVQRTSTDVSAG